MMKNVNSPKMSSLGSMSGCERFWEEVIVSKVMKRAAGDIRYTTCLLNTFPLPHCPPCCYWGNVLGGIYRLARETGCVLLPFHPQDCMQLLIEAASLWQRSKLFAAFVFWYDCLLYFYVALLGVHGISLLLNVLSSLCIDTCVPFAGS